MNTVSRIAKNSLFLLFAKASDGILFFIFVICLARYLGDVVSGKYFTALAFTSFFGVLINFGLDTLLIREVAKDKNQATKYLSSIILLKSLIAIIAFVLIYALTNLLNFPSDTSIAIYILGFSLLFTTTSRSFVSIFNAFEKMEYSAILVILGRLIFVSLSGIFLIRGYGLIPVTSVSLISGTIVVIIGLLFINRGFFKFKIEIDLTFLKGILRTAFPFALLGILGIIYFKIDVIMLSKMKGEAVVGWYGVAHKIIEAFMIIPGSFVVALFPLMSRYYKIAQESLIFAYEKSFKYLFILGLPIAVSSTILANRIIHLFFGEVFNHSIIILQILIWAIPLIFITTLLGYILFSLGEQRKLIPFSISVTLLNVALNFLLIPKYSYIGASTATVISEIVHFAILFALVSKRLYHINLFSLVKRPVLAALVMGISIYYFQFANLALLLGLSTVVYLATLVFIKTFTEEDYSIFNKLIKI